MESAHHKQFTRMISAFVHILFYILFIYLAVVVCYLLVVSVAGRIRPRLIPVTTNLRRFAVLITTFKEDKVIIDTVVNAVGHDYPKNCFDVFVAADQLGEPTLEKLRRTGATIFEMHFESSSKARSLNYLLNNIDEDKYDVALVLDGDNLMTPGLLTKMNDALEKSAVIQAHRTAKNLNGPIAILDAISEEVNNHLFRKAQSNLGHSASLIGSGMTFPFSELKRVYNKPGILDNPACDREIDFEMLVSGLKIRYLDDAYVLDEKVSRQSVYENQRRRWLESQLMHIRLFFSDWNRVKNKSGDFWNKLFINLLPPRLMLFAVFIFVFVVLITGYLAGINPTGISFINWSVLFAAYILSLVLAIPSRFFNLHALKAFLQLPVLFFSFVKAAITIKSGRKEFVHTPKSYTGNSASTKHEQ